MMGVREIDRFLEQWQMGIKALVQERVGRFHRVGQPEGRGETPLPDGSAVKGRRAGISLPE